MKKRTESNEIDIIEIFINIWQNKLKITAITLIFIVLSAITYILFKPKINTRTEIIPISVFENNLYSSFNSIVFNLNNIKTNNKKKDNSEIEETTKDNQLKKIDKKSLLNFYVQELQGREIIIKAIKKFKILNPKKYKNLDEYSEAVEKMALQVKLLKPVNIDGKLRGVSRPNWIIEFKVHDRKKYEQMLNSINIEINKKVKNYIKSNFNLTLNNLRLLKKFEIEDLDILINNAQKNYELETTNRLFFLKEQASIARKLDIENNPNVINETIEMKESINSSATVEFNSQNITPYYMRGYLMIEKEIELIEKRSTKAKDIFNEEILSALQKKRIIEKDKSIDRLEKLFNETPVVKSNDFRAAEIVYKNTKYKKSFSLLNAVLISGLLGFIFAMFYVLISIAIQNRK